MSALTVELGVDCPLISTQSISKRLVEVTVRAAADSGRSESRRRLPLNLAIVIDRSGSMSEARKLEYVKQAAEYVLGLLTEQDRVALVAYDDSIQLLSPSIAVTAAERQRLTQAVRALYTGGSTALFDGWLRGADEVARGLAESGSSSGSINRVLLLTDGLANVGETRQEVLEGHAAALAARGVSTSTFGVGAQFNQFLLEGMARSGSGTYHFIEHPQQIPQLFATELNELLSVVARDAELRISAPETGGASLALFGELNHAKEGAYGVRIPLGNLYAGQQREFYLEALTPPPVAAGSGEQSLVLRAQVSGVDADGASIRSSHELALRYAPDAQVNAAKPDEALQQRSAKVQMAAAETEALRLTEAGRGKDAAKRLRTEVQKLENIMPAPAAAEFREVAERMEQDAMAPMERKQRHSAAYQRQMSRPERGEDDSK